MIIFSVSPFFVINHMMLYTKGNFFCWVYSLHTIFRVNWTSHEKLHYPHHKINRTLCNSQLIKKEPKYQVIWKRSIRELFWIPQYQMKENSRALS